jgi:glycosyltransferase involved in cell wall biosynthesis
MNDSERPLKILVSSHAFAPSIGGIETVSRLLCQEFCRLGHEVVLVTQTADDGAETFPFAVIRRPAIAKLFGLIKWCDVLWQNNLSLRTIWPALLTPKPVVITHQGSYCGEPIGIDLALRAKRAVVNRMTSVAISNAVARCFKMPSLVIPNPYDARVFTVRSTSTERADLIFVGRLVSEKGLDILLESLRRLSSRGLTPRLTIVGSGSEEPRMRALARTLGLEPQVDFVGAKNPTEVAELLNRHAILVVPSRYDEPFGVVALEGIACGCAVVGSSGGGLPEAIGECGVTFANGDIEALADALEKLLRDSDERRRLAANAPQHLARFYPTTIANSYLDLFRSKIP